MLPVTDGFTSYWGDNKLLVSSAYLDAENNGELLIGQEAYDKCLLHPSWYVGEFKRKFALTRPILFAGDLHVTVDQIYTQAFRQLKDVIRRQGDSVDMLVLTHPAAYFKTPDLIRRLVKCANGAGFFDVETIDEPSAAAACYNFQNKNVVGGENVLIYDLGGGTFDAALVQLDDGQFRHLTASMGLPDCGGADMDALIQEDIKACIAAALGNNAAAVLQSRQFQTVLEKTAVQVKHRLSLAEKVTEAILISFDKSIPYTLTRQSFDQMVSPLVTRTIELCRKLVAAAGLEPRKIQRVVLTGGASQLPVIARRLEELFPAAGIGAAQHPEYMVCIGAAVSVKTSQAELMSRRAEKDDKEAQYWLAVSYLNGDEEELGQDHEKAFSWALKAAEQGEPNAQDLLGELFFNGIGTEINKELAELWFKKAAKQGIAAAQDRVGDYYYERGEEETAIFWYSKAAHGGDIDSMNSLGNHYRKNGLHQEAFSWYKKAAEAGNLLAQLMVGVYYREGYGVVEPDADESFSWLMKSAVQGFALAQYEVARMFYHGVPPVSEDNDQAFTWGMKAAEQGDADAQSLIGECFEAGFGTSKDLGAACAWYLKAAEQGSAAAQSRIARWYFHGDGPLPEDNDQAFTWAERAARQDNSSSWLILAQCYESGYGTNVNLREAFNWYNKLAEKDGNSFAQYKLGCWFQEGIDPVSRHPKKGFSWFLQAANQGMPMAQVSVGLCYDNGTGVSEDKKEAFNWYKKAAKQGYPVGERFVGIDYMIGEGVSKNLDKAEKWLRRAMEHGDKEAVSLIKQIAAEQSKPNPKIHFKRDHTFYGSGRHIAIRIDNDRKKDLKDGTSFIVTLEPGKHHIEIAWFPTFGSTVTWTDMIMDEWLPFEKGETLLVDMSFKNPQISWQ